MSFIKRYCKNISNWTSTKLGIAELELQIEKLEKSTQSSSSIEAKQDIRKKRKALFRKKTFLFSLFLTWFVFFILWLFDLLEGNKFDYFRFLLILVQGFFGSLMSVIANKSSKKEKKLNKNEEFLIQNNQQKYTFLKSVSAIVANHLEKIDPKSWNQTSDCFFDIIETFPEERKIWENRNLKYVAYLVFAWDLRGFVGYFTKTLISNAIATRRVSS